jgi:hypothetical protein
MNKKLISFVQVNFQQGPKELNAYYLPYSAGVLLSYAFANDDVQQNWAIDRIVWRRDSIEETAQKLCKNHIVAFSTYVWNRMYNYKLAERIKQLNPDCCIVFGGPEPPVSDPAIFEKFPWMDIVVQLEGEISFGKLLENVGGDLTHIPGLLINKDQTAINTGMPDRINDLDCIPSPYLTGVFDQLIADNPDVTWNATLETNRGCPYQCTFCDWGSLTYNKVKQFNLTRVFNELDWIGERCGFVTITDANFGMFVERDNMIVDHLLAVQQRWNRLTNFSITWAKNQKNEVVDIVRKLINHSKVASQGLTVSVQSMDEAVLSNIKRKNLNQHKINEIFNLCDRYGIPVHTEVILGLPGETANSWKDNFWKLFRAGNHTGISILYAQLLENAEMNLTQKHLWKLKSVPAFDYMSGSYSNGEVEESIDVVVSTKDISADTMLDLMVWNTFIQTFHINGLTTYIARYLASQEVDYKDFYNCLFDFLQTDPWWHQEFVNVRKFYQEWTTHGRVLNPRLGGIEVPGWNLHNRTTLNLHSQNLIPQTYRLVDKFVQQHYNNACVDQLLKFQQATVIDHAKLQQLPLVIDFDYDFWGYLVNGSELNKACTYRFDTAEDRSMSAQMFLENFYFGRKRNFGKTRVELVTSSK